MKKLLIMKKMCWRKMTTKCKPDKSWKCKLTNKI